MRLLRLALLVALVAGARAAGGEYGCCPSCQPCTPNQFGPAGGWNPYGGGLLHWWPRHCFPCCGGPDDYCRKPLPRVCWPGYPPFYILVPYDNCCPRPGIPRDCYRGY
jgi:hypothetical protein